MHDQKVVDPKKPQDLSYEQRRNILAYRMFLNIKNDEVTIKGIGCVDGRKKRKFISKEDTSSSTLYTKGLVLSCMIDAIEGWYVSTTDIPGAFLKTDCDKGYICINVEGGMVTLLEEIYPAYYKDFIYIYIHREKIMYSESKKSIYGTLKASLLFWGELSKSL